MANLSKHEGSDFAPVSRDPLETMRRLIAWDPLRAMNAMNPWAGGWPVSSAASFVPAFDLRETPDGYVLEADLPGVEEKDINVELTGNRLTIRGTRDHEERREEESYHTYERSYGSFSRSFSLPEGTDLERIDAQLANGVLRVQIPKHADVQPRKIKVGKPVERLVEKVKGVLGVGQEKEQERQEARSSQETRSQEARP